MVQLVECPPGDRKIGGSNPGLEIFFSFCTMKSGTGDGAHSALFWVINLHWRSEGSEFTSWLGKKKFFLHNEVRDGARSAPF